ncbi:MAG: DUF262 domain-containing protein [Treponema sp.]|nr:DUF262 domain-containing protein [Treponema sp.]
MDINEQIEKQINEQKKTVDYDTRELIIETIVQKYLDKIEKEQNEIFVPEYQREFTWDNERQSKFIESIILGLPIPLMFLAENSDGRLEIVDGSQRIRTLAAFMQDELKITNLKKLTNLNGLVFSKLPDSRRRKIKNSPLKTIVLRDNTTEEIKNDIFERINRGSDPLYAMEKRKGIFKGKFNDFIYKECAINDTFKRLTPLSPLIDKRQEHEELILRFFALYDAWPKLSFTESMGIANYLDTYIQEMNIEVEKDSNLLQSKRNLFNKMLTFVSESFENGFAKGKIKSVSRVYFEALSVGSALALKERKDLEVSVEKTNAWLKTGELTKITSGKYKTHNKAHIKERIDYVRRSLLNE